MRLNLSGTVKRLNVEHRTSNKDKVSFKIKLTALTATSWADLPYGGTPEAFH